MDNISPTSQSKSKEKKSGKDPQKAVLKPWEPAAVGTGVSASAYNPLLVTFHTLESASSNLFASPHNCSGRFRTIDEGDEQHGGSLGALVECDTASNNGSWSGDSEDHKEKGTRMSGHQDSAPGVDSDKREKIRQKNEKKHQRQKEKRAQELHDRCRSHLMSRKLEALAQQLVGMGFPHERSTMALILNEGRIEESVAWLFEGSEEDGKAHEDQDSDRSNLKIDISNEVAQIAVMESRYNCSKQEVERAVVSCEGDLERASDVLRMQKQEQSSDAKPVDMEDTLDHNAMSHIPARPQLGHGLSSAAIQRDDKDYNTTNAAADSNGRWESSVKNLQPAKRYQTRLDWVTKPKHSATPAEKWATSGANSSISYSMAAPVVTVASKREPLYVAIGNEIKPLPPGSAKVPVTVMQRPQSANQKHSSVPFVVHPPGPTAGWYAANSQLDIMKSSGLLSQIPPSGRNPSPWSATSGMMHVQLNYPQQIDTPANSRKISFQQHQFMPGGGVIGDVPTPGRGNPSWQRTVAYPTLAAASSLGLFSRAGSGSASLGPVNWTDGGNVLKLDYCNIDWSLEANSPGSSSSLWLRLSSLTNNRTTTLYNTNVSRSSSVFSLPSSASSSEAPASDARDWTSPFEGKDLFSLPRQFVSSTSL